MLLTLFREKLKQNIPKKNLIHLSAVTLTSCIVLLILKRTKFGINNDVEKATNLPKPTRMTLFYVLRRFIKRDPALECPLGILNDRFYLPHFCLTSVQSILCFFFLRKIRWYQEAIVVFFYSWHISFFPRLLKDKKWQTCYSTIIIHHIPGARKTEG